MARDRFAQFLSLTYLLILGGLALVGPSGLLAWGENVSRLDQHRQSISQLSEERDELRNRVDLLDPDNVDPDLAGELVRDGLNVVHPDEVIIELK